MAMLHHRIMLYSAVSILFFANLQAVPGITVQNFQIGNIVFGGDDVSIDGTLSVGGRAVLNDSVELVDGGHLTVTGTAAFWDMVTARDVHITGSQLGNSYFYGDVVVTGSMALHGTTTCNSSITVRDDVFVLGSASNVQNQIDGSKLVTIDLTSGRLGYNEAAIEGGGDATFDDEKDNATFGEGSLDAITTGTGNIAIGLNAGASLTTGSNNVYLGTNVDATSAGENNMVRIGTDAHRIFTPGIRGPKSGNLVVVTADGELGITNASSRRYKRNIKSLVEQQSYDAVVEKLKQLQPLTFEYKNDDEQRQNIGLIAEDVAQFFPELVVLDKQGDPDSIKYELLSVLLLHAFQKTEQERNDLSRIVSMLIEKVAKFQKLEELLNTLDDVEIQYLRKQDNAC